MVHLFWNFKRKELKDKTDIQKCNFITRLQQELKIPLGYQAGFDKPYIEVHGRESDMNMMALLGKQLVPRDITMIKVRHLTYQTDEFTEKIQKIAEEELTKDTKIRL
jgi:hypothetical protein